jgi:hypothetical protein
LSIKLRIVYLRSFNARRKEKNLLTLTMCSRQLGRERRRMEIEIKIKLT